MGETTGREQFLGKYQGCLLGGAIGDALGYPVEFDSHDWIVHRFGPDGITAYASDEPVFSDDTQMTLFTAVGLLVGDTQAALAGRPGRLEDPCRYVNLAYLDWLATQHGVSRRTPHVSWIMGIPELNRLRAPGNTCLSALESGGGGTISERINHSKGCGGVMRVAPWGLFLQGEERLGPDGTDHDMTWLVREGAGMAALTHGNPLGWIPAGVLCYLVSRCAFDVPDGAVFSALRHADDFSAAVVSAVNHGGDSDSTGAICGNIVGALLGIDAIGPEWDAIELRDEILGIAGDLCRRCPTDEGGACTDERWLDRYGAVIEG